MNQLLFSSNDTRQPVFDSNDTRQLVFYSNDTRQTVGESNDTRTTVGESNDTRTTVCGSNKTQKTVGSSNDTTHETFINENEIEVIIPSKNQVKSKSKMESKKRKIKQQQNKKNEKVLKKSIKDSLSKCEQRNKSNGETDRTNQKDHAQFGLEMEKIRNEIKSIVQQEIKNGITAIEEEKNRNKTII